MSRRAVVLNSVSLTVAALLLAIVSLNVLEDPDPTFRLLSSAALLSVVAGTQWLLRTSRPRSAAHLFTLALWIVLAMGVVFSGGTASLTAPVLAAVTLIGGLVIGARAAVSYTTLSIVFLFAVYLVTRAGLLPAPQMHYGPFASFTTLSGLLVFTAGVLVIGVRQLERALREARAHEAAMLRSSRRYEALVRSSPVGIVTASAEGVVTSANPASLRMLGYRGDEPIGRDVLATLALGDDQRRAWRRAWRDVVEAGGTLSLRIRHRTPAGEDRHLDVTGSVFDADLDRPVQLLVRDVTETVRQEELASELEAQLRHTQRIESIGLLAGGIAHDFNNLLTVVMAGTEALRRDPTLSSTMQRCVDDIQAASRRAADLTRQLLAFGRKQLMQPRLVDLNELVRENERLLRRVIPERITIRTDLLDALPSIHADPNQISQVIVNLAVNSRDALDGSGTITVRTRVGRLDDDEAHRLDLAGADEYVILEVSDTGAGMTRETVERIFDPFFTTKPRGRGTGLGLSTTLGIVKQTGGSIEVVSAPGLGTTIRIFLQKGEAQRHAQAAPVRAPIEVTGGQCILLVEDDELVRKILSQLLRRSGYDVLVAADGREALDLAGAHEGPIHLLLTDAIMPGMGGAELIRHLARDRPDTRVLLVSGYGGDQLAELESLGSLTILAKPFRLRDLTEKLREALQGPPLTAMTGGEATRSSPERLQT